MNKHLLLGTALLVAISAFPQAEKFSKPVDLSKPTGVIAIAPKKIDFTEPNPQSAAAFTGTAKQIKHVTKTGASNKTSTFGSFIFTGSMNVFGYLLSQGKSLQYQKDINAVSFVARKSNTYTASSNSNSGTIVGLWSLNNGATWDQTCMWSHGTNLARYPNGGIYNPASNTNPNNAYLVGSGPITVTSWQGNWFASKQITTPGNTTGGPDQQSHMDATPTIKKHAMARYAFATEGGIARSMATIVNDINSTANGPTGYGYRGAAMVKGVFTAGAFVWSVDSFIPPVNSTTTGNKILAQVPIQAWDDAGQNGYVVMFGSRAGTNAAMKGYQPIVYKTSTSGASWTLLPANDFTDPNYFKGVWDRTYPVNNNTVVTCANFSGSEGFDAAVDINGQLHLGSMVYGHYYNHVDSLGYRYVFGTEQYSYGESGPFEYPVFYDFYTKSSGGWSYHMIDSMGTEGPSGVSGQPGYGSNVWSDGSGAKMDQDARFQMSRNANGSKIYYSWSESDSGITGLKWNIYPDIKVKGYDVTLNRMTPRYNITTGDPNLDQASYYQYMCNKAIPVSSCVEIPFTMTKNGTLNGGVDVDTYVINSTQICNSAFTIVPLAPTGIASTKNEAVNYDVINFPNPADNATTIVIGLKAATYFEVALYSSVGQLIDTYKVNGHIGSNEINVDLSNYSAGMYFYNVKVGNSLVTKKLVIQ